MPKRATKTVKLKRYRVDKTKLRRPRFELIQDFGDGELKTSWIYPEIEEKTSFVPKEKNLNLKTIYIGRIKLCWYYDTERGFVYSEDGEYRGSFLKHDLKNLFFQIGQLLKEIKK